MPAGRKLHVRERCSARVWSILGLAVLIGGCQSPDVQDGVIAVLRQQQDAWNDGDIDAFLVGYEPTDGLSFSSASGTHRGFEAVRARYLERYPDRAAMGTLTFSELEVTPLGRDFAYVLGRWRLQRESDTPGGVFTVIFRRTEDGWKIVHDHTSAFPPE